ncbi:hypothetical protein D3C73_1561710 [compost metagenome]
MKGVTLILIGAVVIGHTSVEFEVNVVCLEPCNLVDTSWSRKGLLRESCLIKGKKGAYFAE